MSCHLGFFSSSASLSTLCRLIIWIRSLRTVHRSVTKGICLLDLSYVRRNGVEERKLQCYQQWPEVLHIYSLSLTFPFYTHYERISLGFKFLFSYHKNSTIPTQNFEGYFNCQVNFYPTFSQHLQCNNWVECEDRKDETGQCPFSNDACQGKVASGSKCFFAVFTRGTEDSHTVIDSLSRQCQSEGGALAVIQTKEEQDAVYRLMDFHDYCTHYVTGLVYDPKARPNLYRKMWIGMDKSIIYEVFLFSEIRGSLNIEEPLLLEEANENNAQKLHLKLRPRYLVPLYSIDHFKFVFDSCGAVCQSFITAHTNNRSISLNNPRRQNLTTHAASSVITPSYRNLALTVCPKGHLTHLFLTCNVCDKKPFLGKCYFPKSAMPPLQSNSSSGNFDVGSQEPQGQQTSEMSTAVDSRWKEKRERAFVYMFVCDDGNGTVHYTNVCDYRKDCQDGSDETFCSHTPWEQFTCSDGQCAAFYVVCDTVTDCLQDNLDEDLCYSDFISLHQSRQDQELGDRSIINYDGRGFFTHNPVNDSDLCPLTHYHCPGPPHHCLPVYTRCNGFYDCADREDENDCDDPECPGYYRCRESPVCLHPDHLCDGWRQCPEGDDELLCEEKLCPVGCLCHGLAFVCVKAFDVQHFPHIKYLDGSGSHLTPIDLQLNKDLVYLSLMDCGLQSFPEMPFPNLRQLDLSHNQLYNVSVNIFLVLQNVRFVSLAHNPLHALYSQQSDQKQNTLKHVDLAFTEIRSINTEPFSHFMSLQKLNLSQAGVSTILPGGFQHVRFLTELDLSGCPVENFPPDLFQGLSKLENVKADTFKLCCASILPANFDNFCFAPQDEISSCEDLVRSATYRGLLWLVSFLSVFGNGFCLVYRMFVQRKSSKNSFNMFVSNLSVADFIMGVYLAIIGIADLSYRGVYLHYDVTWTRSAACHAAGFLSLLSNQMSSFTVALITLDRFIVLRFPFSRVRFGRRSTTFVLTLSWIVSFILAVVPLLPVTSHWHFYSQTGICIPLPITRTDFSGRTYSLGIVVCINFVLFLLIAGGQVAIYDSVRQNTMDWHSTSSKSKVKDATVTRRLITVAITNFLCWFPIGFCGLLSSFAIPIPGEINVAAAILVLPLNSALNPFLYTLNVAIEIRRRRSRDRLWEMLLNTLQKK